MANLNKNQSKLYDLCLKYNEDPAKWLAIYEIESASGKNMNAASGATGHFQIMPAFFGDYGVTRDDAMDLEKSFLAVRKHHARHSAQLRAKLGRELTAGEYYLGHQQGWTGATALLSHPKDNVVDALATVMSRKKAENSVKQNGGKTSMTAEQFANMWIKRADDLQEKYNNQGYGRKDHQDDKLNFPEKDTNTSQSKYKETRSMLQNLLNDTDGSYAKKLLANNQEEVASFSEKIQGRIEQTKLQELTERESRNTLQQEEQQRGFSRSV